MKETVIIGACALALGAASCILARHVEVGAAGTFFDFWLGAVSIICGVGAVIMAGAAVAEAID